MIQILQLGILNEQDLDSQNKTPHMNLYARQDLYDYFHQKDISVSFTSIKMYRDYVCVHFDHTVHFTLVFKRGLKNDHQDRVRKEILDLWHQL
jgi:capsule polysaccharide export protein KpsE/RkpR